MELIARNKQCDNSRVFKILPHVTGAILLLFLTHHKPRSQFCHHRLEAWKGCVWLRGTSFLLQVECCPPMLYGLEGKVTSSYTQMNIMWWRVVLFAVCQIRKFWDFSLCQHWLLLLLVSYIGFYIYETCAFAMQALAYHLEMIRYSLLAETNYINKCRGKVNTLKEVNHSNRKGHLVLRG